MQSTRCKFACESIKPACPDVPGSTAMKVVFEARYCPEVPDDVRFTKYTPQGRVETIIDNPASLAMLEVGEQYYFDISPVPADAAK